jgi:hypothetical protein
LLGAARRAAADDDADDDAALSAKLQDMRRTASRATMKAPMTLMLNMVLHPPSYPQPVSGATMLPTVSAAEAGVEFAEHAFDFAYVTRRPETAPFSLPGARTSGVTPGVTMSLR